MITRKTPSETVRVPQNIAVSNTVHRTTKLSSRRRKTLNFDGAVAGGGGDTGEPGDLVEITFG